MDIGIVGAGKAGCSIGKYLKEHGMAVAGYFSRSKESVEWAATFTGTEAFPTLANLVKACGIIFIATPDNAIREVWENIAGNSIQGKIICHFSGSLSSVVFSDREKAGAFGCSVHPMYAFSNKYTSYRQLNQVMFTAEGDPEALDAVCGLFGRMGNSVCIINSEKKERYHAAASMVSNMMVGLYQMGIDMLTDCGFDEDGARTMARPLVRGNIDNLLETSPERALTGPVERNDTETVGKHLAALRGREREVYVNLAWTLVGIAKRKNPGRDYTALMEMLMDG